VARLLLKSKGPVPQVIDLHEGLNRIGRGEASDFQIEDESLSELHCEVEVADNRVFVRDLESTNGTYIDGQPIRESALAAGQTLQLGMVEMVLDVTETKLAIPDLPPPEPIEAQSIQLDDGYAACLNHGTRHAAWVCKQCSREYCDECIRKLRREGGAYLRFCPTCGAQCKLTAWSQAMKRKKKSIFAALADKMRTRLLQTKKLFGTRKVDREPGE
jgi:hypothetical protein